MDPAHGRQQAIDPPAFSLERLTGIVHSHDRTCGQQPFGEARTPNTVAGTRSHDTWQTFASVLLSGRGSVAPAAEYLCHRPAVLLGASAHLMPADHAPARSVVAATLASPRVTAVS